MIHKKKHTHTHKNLIEINLLDFSAKLLGCHIFPHVYHA